jgi:site-specific recombinase XerC
MKTSLRLEGLFTLEEQLEIVGTVGKIKQEYEREEIPKKRRYYFRELADKYQLAHRIKHQLEAYEKRLLKMNEIATDKDLTKLFGVKIYTIQKYLASRKDTLNTEELKRRATLCLVAGRAKGWDYLVKSGQRHTPTYEDITKSKKKKNGKNKRNNQDPRTS